MIELWCEWDIGQDSTIFTTKERAEAFARKSLELQGFEETLEELLEDGLIGFQEIRIDPN